jgi:putative SOS response-associated peptidase YedK
MVHRAHPDLDIQDWIDEDDFQPRYNVAPRSRSPVIRRADQGPQAGPAPRERQTEDNEASTSAGAPSSLTSESSKPKHVLHTMKWGLVPSWSKHEDKSLSTTNARAENLVEGGGMWNSMRGKKRCAVLCQGFVLLSMFIFRLP